MKKILLLSDNEELIFRFRRLIQTKVFFKITEFEFFFAYSENNSALNSIYNNADWIKPINIKKEIDSLINEYDLIFSLHCKQIFPEKLVKSVRCINIHPGLNPYNRGWFPQVFSIINNLPCGATIHEIDEHLDHGPIICQKEVKIEMWDTSLTAYNKIMTTEIELLSDNFEIILLNQYETFKPKEGNLNLKKDFEDLCKLNLDDIDSFLNHINKLRALTHGNYTNTYFIDKETEKKVYIKIEMSYE